MNELPQLSKETHWHDLIDRRSLDMHALMAEKIRSNPALFNIVNETLARWLNKPEPHLATLEWKEFIESHPLEEVLDYICSWTEESRRMRQSSPFVGIMTEEERMEIFRKYEPYRMR